MIDELKQWEQDRGYDKGRADAVKEVIPLLRAIKFVLDDYATRLSDYSKVIDEHLKGADNGE